jgi:hypothetical protein
METRDEQLRKQILRKIPKDLRQQLHLPEGVDALSLLDSLLAQVHDAFNALMRQPKGAYSKAAQRWAGCFAHLAKTYLILRDLQAQEVPSEAFDLRLELKMAQRLSEWLKDQRLRPAA